MLGLVCLGSNYIEMRQCDNGDSNLDAVKSETEAIYLHIAMVYDSS